MKHTATTKAKDSVKITERGWPGHFCCSDRCLFHRNTLLEYKNKKVVVSTVGELQRSSYNKKCTPLDGFNEYFETVGLDRYFETMAFMAKENDIFNDADVSRQVLFDSNWKLNDPYAEIEANEMHDAVVKEISADLLNNKLRIEQI